MAYPTAKAKALQQQLTLKGDELYQKMVDNLGKNKMTELVSSLRKTGENL